MRILAIRGANLASLAEEFEIDLAGGPLATAGLFAITGPTGAGKSTLLDALCLALFDRTPRLGGRGAVLIGRGDELGRIGAHDVRSLLRRGATAGWAEVDFEGVDGRRYRARWSVRRARGKSTGKLQDQQVTLEALDETLAGGARLGGTRTETLEAIRSRLGLSFDQFRRSALLAQGDFAAFLRADAADRADLLERMTGTEIYGAVSMAAHRKAAEVEVGLRACRDAAARIAVLDDDARAAAEIGRAGAGEALAMARREVTAREAAVAWADEQRRLAERVAAAEDEALAVAAATAAAEDRRALLRRAEAAEVLRPAWDERERARRDRAAAEAARARAETARRAGAAARDAAAMAEQAADEALVRARDALARIPVPAPPASAESPERASDATIELDTLPARIAEETARADAAARWLAEHTGAARLGADWPRCERLLARDGEAWAAQVLARRRDDDLAAALHAAEGRRAVFEQERAEAAAGVEEAELTADNAEDKRRAQPLQAATRGCDAAVRRVDAAGSLLAVVDAARAAAAEEDGAWARAEAAAAQVAAETEGAAGVDAAAAALSDRLEEAQVGLDRLRFAAGFAHVRAELAAGAPCPVCGATEHPWNGAEDNPVDALVAEQAERVAGLRRDQREAAAAAARARAAADVARRDLAAATGAAESARAGRARAAEAWRAALAALGELPLVDDPGSEAAAAMVADRMRAAERERKRAETVLAEATRADLEARRAQEVVLARRNNLDAAERALRSAVEAVAHIAAERVVEQAAIAKQVAVRAAALDELAELLGDRGRWRARLDDDRAALVAELAAAAASWRRRASALAAAAHELAELAAAADDHRLEAERRAASAEADARTADAARDRAILALVAAEQALSAGLVTSELFEEALAELLGRGPAFVAELRAELDALGRRAAEAQAVLSERRSRLATHAASRPDPVDPTGDSALRPTGQAGEAPIPRALDSVTDPTALAAARAGVIAAEQRLAEAVFLVRSDDDARARRAAAAAELATAESEAEVHRQLAALIGSHDGKAFRAFAQSLSLDALLVVANHHLDELAPRYQLERVPGFDLELQVVDRDMGDEVRSVNSLSGGESFLVSLALALALSSLSAQNVRVRTLLVDEGFGTLDPATLDVALAVLDALQASGRQVGIISHVPGLAERVGCQVLVQPVGGGRSVVDVRAAS